MTLDVYSVPDANAREIVSRKGLPAWLPSLQRGYKAKHRNLTKNERMSSRVLRKLQGDKELEISHGDDDDEEELNVASVKSKKKQKAVVNPFDLVSSTNHLPTHT